MLVWLQITNYSLSFGSCGQDAIHYFNNIDNIMLPIRLIIYVVHVTIQRVALPSLIGYLSNKSVDMLHKVLIWCTPDVQAHAYFMDLQVLLFLAPECS